MHVDYLILGAGPTGLGAANRLRELGCESFLILEREDHVGGLSASFTDARGFTWDIGGHVAFSHYEYFDRLLDGLLGDDRLEHQRISRVRCAGTWVPYPFQNNVRHLPPKERWECLRGLLPGRRPEGQPTNFKEWFRHVFGDGIARLFMEPYNFKVWATPAELMGFGWIGERVSLVDLERVARNLALDEDDVAWGPNNTFRFPLHGGTGEIFRRLAARVEDRIILNSPAAEVDVEGKTVRTPDGREFGYTHLLSTIPLDLLAGEMIPQSPEAVRRAAGNLAHNSVHVVGAGVEGPGTDDTCWMYFPESDCPFYRVTNFHNYSPNNVARPGEQRALMTETSSSEHKPVDKAGLAGLTVDGLRNATLLAGSEEPCSVWEHDVEYGYPVPTLERDAALSVIQPWLEARGVFSRGRFGGWKYEVGNMDHSVMQGVEWAQRMLNRDPETTYVHDAE
ncbi:protoporphyrinogen/coproporphyrinogen oxidase [Desulfohalovibrio reitneri]|uniref:protoporphyrinogen/coproporphyrinogen oxidase n=1 Tax=Desulfohalovibrio reitneri TaxID=1307759 RepID=UPI0004A6BE9D|nr:FAD-dependent oxidoreductase [Desulfohalovibrio reitneri]